jgi:hypothetical protein
MKIHKLHALLLSLSGLVGCWGDRAEVPPPQFVNGPHGGLSYRLPDDRGYAEIINEPPISASGGTPQTAVVVYFLGTDARTPLESKPTGVKVELDLGRRRNTLPLSPSALAGDPSGSNRFVSKTGPYVIADARGLLTTTLDGKTFTLDFSTRR